MTSSKMHSSVPIFQPPSTSYNVPRVNLPPSQPSPVSPSNQMPLSGASLVAPNSLGAANTNLGVSSLMSSSNMSIGSIGKPSNAPIVKEGWLMKRGEHIRNWRRRYFVLREDGTFYGYKTKPQPAAGGTEPDFENTPPLNNFTVRSCQLMKASKPKPFTFIIRGLQLTTIVERMFYVETSEEREDWLRSIQQVANGIRESHASTAASATATAAAASGSSSGASAAAAGSNSATCEVMDVSETGDPFLTPYSRNPYQRTGKTRHVLRSVHTRVHSVCSVVYTV